MHDPTIYETIERYLLDQLPAAERLDLETRLAADPALAEQFNRQKQEHLALSVLVEDALRDRLDDWKKSAPPDERPSLVSGILLFVIGASLLGVFIWWLAPNTKPAAPEPAPRPPQSQQPIAQSPPAPTLAPPANPDTPILPPPAPAPDYLALATAFDEPVRYGEGGIRQGDTTANSINTALRELSEKKYRQGLAMLQTIPAGHPDFADAQYYQGLAWYEQGVFRRAIPFLKKTAESEEYLYSEQAAWFLTLAYLKNKQAAPGIRLARRIAADAGHAYQDKAKALLRRL